MADEKVRNPWIFPIMSVALGMTIESDQIVICDAEVAEAACRTGVLQQTVNGVWQFDGKCDLEGRRTDIPTEVD